METQVTYIQPDGQWLRLTIGVCSAIDLARFRKYRREANDWIQERLALDPMGDWPEDIDEVAVESANVAWQRARMLTSLKKVELGAPTEGDGEPTEWRDAELPAAWQTIEGFVTLVPAMFHYGWLRLVDLHNPGLFGQGSNSEEKKRRGSVFVN